MDNGEFYRAMLEQQGKMLDGQAEQERRLCDKIDAGNDVIIQKIGEIGERVAVVETRQEGHAENHKKADRRAAGFGAASGGATGIVLIVIDAIRRAFTGG